MTLRVIDNPAFDPKTGFTNAQFKGLDDLFCRSAAEKILTHRTVEVDFEEETASYTYFKSEYHAPAFQFLIRRVGPKTMMYEVFKEGKGRIAKSGIFDKAYEKLSQEIQALI